MHMQVEMIIVEPCSEARRALMDHTVNAWNIPAPGISILRGNVDTLEEKARKRNSRAPIQRIHLASNQAKQLSERVIDQGKAAKGAVLMTGIIDRTA